MIGRVASGRTQTAGGRLGRRGRTNDGGEGGVRVKSEMGWRWEQVHRREESGVRGAVVGVLCLLCLLLLLLLLLLPPPPPPLFLKFRPLQRLLIGDLNLPIFVTIYIYILTSYLLTLPTFFLALSYYIIYTILYLPTLFMIMYTLNSWSNFQNPPPYALIYILYPDRDCEV